MPTTPPAASDVERRKKVRIRMRRDLDIAPQKYEGRTYYVVKDPVSLRYYRFKEQEHFLIELMDGTTTLDDAQKDYEKRFRPERLTLEDLEGFAQQLLTAGLAQNESPQAGKQLYDRRKKRRRTEWMQTLTNILYIKIPLYDPDKLLDRMLPYLRWIYTGWFLALSIVVMLGSLLFVALHFETFWDRLPNYREFFSFNALLMTWLLLGVVKVIHEFGHGLSCKAFRGEVHEMGLLFLVFSPCMYCNVSDAWKLPNKWKRIIISAAGIYVEFMIACLAAIVWWYSPNTPVVNNTCLYLMVLCTVSTFVFNANPLMRYDGYYVLADWLEIPNLRDRSNRYLQRLVMDYGLGIEVQPEQYMALWRRILFVLYAITSYVYRWYITIRILLFMAEFLAPYKLGAISKMLACAAAGSMIGWPIYRLGKNLHKRGRLPDMKSTRVTLSAIAVSAVLLFIFLVPLPVVSHIRQRALVQVQDDYVKRAVVPMTGILERLDVRDGERVEKDQVLAQFRSLDKENEWEEAWTQRKIYLDELQMRNKEAAGSDLSEEEKKRLAPLIADAESKYRHYDKLAQGLDDQLKGLKLTAPCAGVVMSPPHIDEVGKLYEKGTQFCSIGDPQHLRVWMPVSPAEYRLIMGDLREKLDQDEDLLVDIRVQGRAERVWHGKLKRSQLPEAEAKEIPLALTNKAGGSVAVKPSSKPDHYIPQSQQYLVSIAILDSDDAICPGTMAQAKVHCRWRTTAWWAWHMFSSAFDLGMEPSDLLPRFMRPRE